MEWEVVPEQLMLVSQHSNPAFWKLLFSSKRLSSDSPGKTQNFENLSLKLTLAFTLRQKRDDTPSSPTTCELGTEAQRWCKGAHSINGWMPNSETIQEMLVQAEELLKIQNSWLGRDHWALKRVFTPWMLQEWMGISALVVATTGRFQYTSSLEWWPLQGGLSIKYIPLA